MFVGVDRHTVGGVMKIKIVAVGKIKEEFFRQAIAEYVKRIGRFATVEIAEVDECYFDGTPNAKQIEQILATEAKTILSKAEGCVIVLDIDGKQLDSVQISKFIQQRKQTDSTFTFVIGSSNGLSQVVKSRADLRLSFGKITLPHQLCRVVLCEQIYRSCCIANNVPYHK